jgi:hypothetical protein
MGCLRLRGSARAMDMAKLCHDQVWALDGNVGGCNSTVWRAHVAGLAMGRGGCMDLRGSGAFANQFGQTGCLLRWRLGSSATNLVFGAS